MSAGRLLRTSPAGMERIGIPLETGSARTATSGQFMCMTFYLAPATCTQLGLSKLREHRLFGSWRTGTGVHGPRWAEGLMERHAHFGARALTFTLPEVLPQLEV